MGALNGQIISTITDGQGNPAVIISWFFDPTTRVLRNNPADWTDAAGTLWPAGSGACIADNLLGRQIRVAINDSSGNTLRQVKIGTGGRTFTKNQLANAAPPDGPYTTADDFNGLTFDFS
jgi:hypothetical protein